MFILIKHLKLNFAFEGMKTLAELVVIQNSLKSELTICKKKVFGIEILQKMVG